MLDIKYIPNYAKVEHYEELLGIGWVKVGNTPRKEYWDTTLNEPYTYGAGRGIRTYQPNKPLRIVQYYRELLMSSLGVNFHGCFLNKYDTERDHLGWHSDDDPLIDHSCPIAVITLGSGREINWKKIGSKGSESISSQFLENGSLFIMPAGMQSEYYHKIPKSPFPVNPRISMTFRSLIERK